MRAIYISVGIAVALMCVGSITTAATGGANGSAVIPAEAGHVVSLDGKWRFKLEQSKMPAEFATGRETRGTPAAIDYPATFEPFYATDYREDGSWHDLGVPSNWEMAGYSPATYFQPDNSSGFYRKWIDVPADWAGRLVKVNFDGVQCGAEVWLNGEPVNVTEPSWGRPNYHESGWTAWQADLTPAAKFGERNLLALRVTKNTKSSDLDSGDYFFLGGIYRPVTLFSVPQAHIKDLTVQTKLLPNNKAEVKVTAAVAGDAKQVRMQLEGLDSVTARVENGQATLTQIVSKPRLWSAEYPNLYSLIVTVQNGENKEIERVTRKIGIREVSIKNGVMLVNGVPVKLTGACRHDLSAENGTAVGPDLWRKDLTLMKAANINAIRTSHYPYGSGFYDLCDEMGFYVADELPYCWCDPRDTTLTPAYEQRARETVARDKNHPCVIIWAIGNENVEGVNSQIAADIVKRLDPTRPRLVSRMTADLYGTEMDDLHYSSPARIRQTLEDKERRAKWPQIFLENPNVWDVRYGADYGCLDAWTEVLKRCWDVVWSSDSIAGSFFWEWADRAVADKCPTKPYNYDPATGIDCVKTKGVVDSRRNPRPDYYAVKMVHTPVMIGRELDTGTRPGVAVMEITNRYSFTDLSELNAKWRLAKDGKTLDSGVAHLKLAPRTTGKVELTLPADKMGTADALRIDFDHPQGWNVVSYQFALGNQVHASMLDPKLPDGLLFPKFNLIRNVTNPDTITWRRITRYRGELRNVKTESADSRPYYEQPMASIRSLDADIVLADAPTEPKGAVEDEKNRPKLGVVVGHVHAEFVGGEFRYRVEWTGPKSEIQELGWTFAMPKACDHFSWQRQAPWSVYPDTHIGRPKGTALPDSANVHVTDNTRPDAFDFNSTKYNCDWAALTDAKGRGLRVEFPAEKREHVKGGFGSDGGYSLIVNKQVSPPSGELSSGVVKDFYLALTRGDKVEGAFRVGSNRVSK